MEAKKYVRLIKPVMCYPDQSYKPVFKDLESPEVWYPEDREQELTEKYGHINGMFRDLVFKEKFVEMKT